MYKEFKNILLAVLRGVKAASKAFKKEVINARISETEKAQQFMKRAELYGKGIQADFAKRKPKQTIKYGGKVVMLSKHQPITLEFWG